MNVPITPRRNGASKASMDFKLPPLLTWYGWSEGLRRQYLRALREGNLAFAWCQACFYPKSLKDMVPLCEACGIESGEIVYVDGTKLPLHPLLVDKWQGEIPLPGDNSPEM